MPSPSLQKEVQTLWQLRRNKKLPLDELEINARTLNKLSKKHIQQRQELKAKIDENVQQAENKLKALSKNISIISNHGLDNLSEKQLQALNELDKTVTSVMMVKRDLFEKFGIAEANKRLESTLKDLQGILNNVLKKKFLFNNYTVKKIYTAYLDMKPDVPKENTVVTNSAKKLIAETNKAKGEMLSQFANQLVSTLKYDAKNKKLSALLEKRLKKQKALITDLISPFPDGKAKNYWQQSENIFNFLQLLTRDDLSALIKSQVNNGKRRDEAVRSFMINNGFNTSSQPAKLIKLAERLFEGKDGDKLKAALREPLAAHALYQAGIDMLQKPSVEERSTIFNKLKTTLSENKWWAGWNPFFANRPEMNLGKKFGGKEGPLDKPAILSNIRAALARENNPLFNDLIDQVDNLDGNKELKAASKPTLKIDISLTCRPNETNNLASPSFGLGAHRNSMWASTTIRDDMDNDKSSVIYLNDDEPSQSQVIVLR